MTEKKKTPMKLRKWSELKRTRHTAEQIARIEAEADRELLEEKLADMRKLAGMTQAEVAQKAGMTQGEISKLEQRDDFHLSTFMRYAKALGGDVEIRFTIGNKSMRLA